MKKNQILRQALALAEAMQSTATVICYKTAAGTRQVTARTAHRTDPGIDRPTRTLRGVTLLGERLVIPIDKLVFNA